MPNREGQDEVSRFLTGEPAVHEAIRGAVRKVVRSFRFRGAGLEEDLVQETVARVFENLRAGAFRGDASLSTYSQRVARYTCIKHIRRRRFMAEIDPAGMSAHDPGGGPEATLLRAEDHRRNLAILATLSPACRELLRLVFIDGLTYAEVGERLGISETAVKLRVYRCRLTMRSSEIEDHDGGMAPEPSVGWRHYERGKE